MKKKLIIAVSLIFLASGSYAKGRGGIYKNVADYENRKLSYEEDCAEGNFKIHLRDFFGNTPSFTIKYNGKKESLIKNEVYGFQDCDGNVYRFYANGTYKITEPGKIYIYTQQRNITQTKGFKVVNDCYFSTSPDGKIVRLSYENLVNAFHDNEKFLDELEKDRRGVTDYDTRHKMYRINYLLTQSQKKQSI